MEQDKEQLLVALNKFVDDALDIDSAINSILGNRIFHDVWSNRKIFCDILRIHEQYRNTVIKSLSEIQYRLVADLTNTSAEPESSE